MPTHSSVLSEQRVAIDGHIPAVEIIPPSYSAYICMCSFNDWKSKNFRDTHFWETQREVVQKIDFSDKVLNKLVLGLQ